MVDKVEAARKKLMDSTVAAVESGTLNRNNYLDAISATRDNPDVKSYLESVFPDEDQDTSDAPEGAVLVSEVDSNDNQNAVKSADTDPVDTDPVDTDPVDIDTVDIDTAEPVDIDTAEPVDNLTMGDPLAVEGLPITQADGIDIPFSFSGPSQFLNTNVTVIDDRVIPQDVIDAEVQQIVQDNQDSPNTFIVNGYRVSQDTFNLYLQQREEFTQTGYDEDVQALNQDGDIELDIPEGFSLVQEDEDVIPDGFTPVTQPQQIPDINIDLPENVDIKKQVDSNLSDLEELANLRFSAEQIAEWKKSPISAEEAPDFMGYEDWVPGGGVYQGAEALKLLDIVTDLEEGKKVSEADQDKLNNWLDKHVEIAVRGFDWGGGMVYHGAGIPAIMVEFWLSGGAGKIAQVGATKALTKTVTEVAVANATRAAKVKAAAIGATALTARLGTQAALTPGIYVDIYGDRRLTDRLNITQQGKVIFKLSSESPAKAALMAFAYTNVEIVAELAGGRIIKGAKYVGNKSGVNKHVIDPVTMRVKSMGLTSLGKLPEKVKIALFKAYQRIKPNARMSEVFTQAGWHGLLAEFSEEQLAKILSSAVGYTLEEDYTMADVLENTLSVLDPDQFALEVGLLVATKGGITAVNGVKGSYQYQKNQAAQKAFEQLPMEDQMRILTSMLNVQEAPTVSGFNRAPFLPQQTAQEVLGVDTSGSKADDVVEIDPEADLKTIQKKKQLTIEQLEVKRIELKAEEKKIEQSKLNQSDTRGGDQQYHGTSSPLGTLDEYTYSPMNIYGQGFYTTDATDIAAGYSNKGKGKEPVMYKAIVKGNPKLYDMDAPLTDEIKAKLQDVLGEDYLYFIDNDPVTGEDIYKDYTSLTELYDAMRDELDYSTDTIQELFDTIEVSLREEGFEGFTHVGGKHTNKKPHKVEIYWNPKENIELEQVEIPAKKIAKESEKLQPLRDEVSKLENDLIADESAEIIASDNLSEFEFSQIGPDNFVALSDFSDQLNLKFTPVANPPGATRDGAPLPDEAPKSSIDYTESMWSTMYKNFIDDFAPALKLLEVAESRGLTVEDGASPRILAKTFYGIVSKVEENLADNTFYFDEKGNKVITGLGLGKILEDFDFEMLTTEKNQKQRRLDLSTYLIAKRIVEDLVDMDGVTITDKQLEQARLDLANLEVKYGDNFEIFDMQSQEIYKFQRNIMENLVRSGNMSKKEYGDIVKANPNYIPFKRVMDDKGYIESGIGGQFDNASSKGLTLKLKGSERAIKDPIQSIISNTVRTISIADRNSVARSVVNLAEFLPEYVIRSKGKTIVTTDPKTGSKIFNKEPAENDIVIYVNGKRQFWNVPPGVKDAMQGLDPVMLGTTERLLVGAVKVARTGITAVPSFIVKNVFRDQFVTSIQSGTFKTPIDTIAGLLSIMNVRNPQLYKDWKASGAAQSFYMDISDTGLADAAKEFYSNDSNLLKVIKSPIKSYLNAALVFENSTRVGAYQAAKRAGMSDLAAGNAAREASVDFARGGKISKAINRHLMFLNVGIQGAARMAETFKRNPKMASLIATTTITVPSVMLTLYYLYEAPEEEREEYLEIPAIQRANNWAYKSGEQWHLIPKPFSYGYVFGTAPELFLIDMYKGDKPEGKELWIELSQGLPRSVSPIQGVSGIFPSTLKAVVEPLTGFDFWQDRQVSTAWMDKLDPEFRVTRGTSETTKFLGELTGFSPVGIDQFTKNVIGTSAQYLTGAGDKILAEVRELNDELQNERPETSRDNLITKGWLLEDPISLNSITVSTFFELSLEVERKVNSYNSLPFHKQEEYRENNEFILNNDYIMLDAMKYIREDLAYRNEILDDYSLDAEQKRTIIEPIERQIYMEAYNANATWVKLLDDYLDVE